MIARQICALLIAGASASATDLYRVAGTILNEQAGTPLPHAEVYVYKSGTSVPRTPFVTGNDGRFSFDLPQGTYVMRAGTRTLIESYGSRSQEIALGSAVIVGPDQDTSNLIFRWYPAAAISGRIVDENGEPAEDVLVQLLLARTNAGRPVTTTARWVRTNDRGEYRFGLIPGGGRYYVAATGKPWYEKDTVVIPGEPAERRAVAFAPVYYPNTSDVSKAEPLVVKPGEEGHADFTMTPAPGATVTVTCKTSADLKGTLSLITDGVGGTESFQEQRAVTIVSDSARQIPLTILSVPPGHYIAKVTGTSSGGQFSGHVAVDVNGSDVTVDVPLLPAAAVNGVIQFADGMARPAGPLRVSLLAEFGGLTSTTFVQPDGSFTFPRVADGRFHVVVGASSPLFLAEVKGADFRTGLITLSAGDSVTLSLTLSNRLGNLDGLVIDGDRPAPAVLVVLAPTEESPDAAHYQGFQTESDGSFAYRNVPAGSYYLFAVDDPTFEYANPDVVRAYLADARVITIGGKALSKERIPLSPRR